MNDDTRLGQPIDFNGPFPDFSDPLVLIDQTAGRCWIWTGNVRYDGYGIVYVKKPSGGYTSMQAHRRIFERIHGPIDAGLVLDHLCRNRLCVRPGHMDPVPQRENVMRGNGIMAKFAAQTHCLRRHEFTAENTYLRVTNKGTSRVCRECKRLYRRRARVAV